MFRVYLDNCCFNRPFDNQSHLKIRLETEAKLEIQARIAAGELELAWSYILDYENEANPFAERRDAIRIWRNLACTDQMATEDVIKKAKALALLGMKNKDSLHLACAIATNSDVFLTTDGGILRKRETIREIRVCSPVDFIQEEIR